MKLATSKIEMLIESVRLIARHLDHPNAPDSPSSKDAAVLFEAASRLAASPLKPICEWIVLAIEGARSRAGQLRKDADNVWDCRAYACHQGGQLRPRR